MAIPQPHRLPFDKNGKMTYLGRKRLAIDDLFEFRFMESANQYFRDLCRFNRQLQIEFNEGRYVYIVTGKALAEIKMKSYLDKNYLGFQLVGVGGMEGEWHSIAVLNRFAVGDEIDFWVVLDPNGAINILIEPVDALEPPPIRSNL